MEDTTFLFTDIEGSTRLWERQPGAMSVAVARHDALLRQVILSHGGEIVKFSGDGIHAAFGNAQQALHAAINIQRRIRQSPTDDLALAIRCGLHMGPAEARDGDYFGTTVNRASRLCNAANGGQIIISAALYARIADNLSPPLSTRCLGTVRLRSLADAETVHQLLHPDLPSDFAPLRTLSTKPNNLPFFATAFIGRYREIGDIAKLVQQSRLVTLIGIGGIGKTRLAMQAAAYLLDQFPDGVWVCELATINDTFLIPTHLMQTLNIKAQGTATPIAQIINYCFDKKILVLLDNCEHLIDGVAHFCSQLLKQAPTVHILATSREGIEIDGETAYQLPVLNIPDPDFFSGTRIDIINAIREVDSVRLFLDRALLHRPDFVLHSHDVGVLARICYRLDGIPLAIELAAARLRTMSLVQVDRGMDDRFGLLVVGSRVAAPRHKTLRATLEWSYGLLNDDERTLFDRLAVFMGGGAIDAVAHMNADLAQQAQPHTHATMQSLADKSLIQLFDIAGQSRFSMLETLRQYAQQKLATAGYLPKFVNSHAQWYRQFAVNATADFFNDKRLTVLKRLADDQANLRTAITHFIDTEPDAALDLCIALGYFWLWRGQYAEAKKSLEAALAAQLRVGHIPEIIESKARHFAAGNCYMMSELAGAETHCKHALDASLRINDDVSAGNAMAMLGNVQYVLHGYAASRKFYEDGIRLLLRGGDIRHAADNVSNIANNAAYANDIEASAQYLAQLEQLATQLDEPFIWARLASSRGQFALHRGLYAEAVKWLKQNLTISQQMSDQSHEGIGHFLLGAALTGQGAMADAAIAFDTSIKMLSEQNAQIELCNAIEAFAFWCAQRGDDISAVQLCAATLTARAVIGFPVGAQAREARRRALAASEATMDTAEHNKAIESGNQMTLEEATKLAYNLANSASDSVLD